MVLAFYHLNWILNSVIYAIKLPEFRRTLRDGLLENLGWGGGGGGGEVQKKYSVKGKLNEKNSCTPINPKNIHAMA